MARHFHVRRSESTRLLRRRLPPLLMKYRYRINGDIDASLAAAAAAAATDALCIMTNRYLASAGGRLAGCRLLHRHAVRLMENASRMYIVGVVTSRNASSLPVSDTRQWRRYHHHRLLRKKQHIEIYTHKKKLTLETYYNECGKIKARL